MLKPRYYFADDFRIFYEYFLSQPHTERTFHKGITSGIPDSRMIVSNTMYPVHLFIFLNTKAEDGKSSAFMDRGRFFQDITQMTFALSSP